MTEKFEHLQGMSERDILENMGAEALTKHIIRLGERATHIETKMNEASAVLEGAYGVSVEEMLRRKEARAGE